MFSLLLGKTNKRYNSTARPPCSTEISVCLKKSTDCNNPTFEFTTLDYATIASYNYAYCPTLQRYYWITSVDYAEAVVSIHCKCDSLATLQSDIKSTKCMIDYATKKWDGWLTESRYPVPRYETTSIMYTESEAVTDELTESYIVSVWGADNGESTYYMTPTQYKTLIDFINSDSIVGLWSGKVASLVDALKSAIIEPSQYITQVVKIPFIPNLAQQASDVNVGFGSIGVTGHPFKTGTVLYKMYRLSIPAAWGTVDSTSYYKMFEPYTHFYLHIPFVGDVPIRFKRSPLGSSVVVYYTISANGDITADIYTGDGYEALGTYRGNCGVNVGVNPVDNSSVPEMIGDMTTGVIGATSSALAGNYVGAASTVMSTAYNTVSGIMKPSATTTAGGRVVRDALMKFRLVAEYTGHLEGDASLYGYPYGKVDTISNVWGGYCQTRGCIVASTFNNELNLEASNALEKGVYLED